MSRQITAMAESGELAKGTSLPSERVLAEALNLSRTTVKHAYALLNEQGLVSRHGRLGTVIGTPPLRPAMDRLKGFTEEMRQLGLKPSSRILEQRVVTDRAIASIFQRSSNAPFLKLVRVRSGDGKPLSREVAWYDLTALPELAQQDLSESVYRTIQSKCGVILQNCEQSIEAVLSSPEENKVFGYAAATPCLLIKRHTYDTGGRVIEYVEGLFRGDAYAYRMTLQA